MRGRNILRLKKVNRAWKKYIEVEKNESCVEKNLLRLKKVNRAWKKYIEVEKG